MYFPAEVMQNKPWFNYQVTENTVDPMYAHVSCAVVEELICTNKLLWGSEEESVDCPCGVGG